MRVPTRTTKAIGRERRSYWPFSEERSKQLGRGMWSGSSGFGPFHPVSSSRTPPLQVCPNHILVSKAHLEGSGQTTTRACTPAGQAHHSDECSRIKQNSPQLSKSTTTYPKGATEAPALIDRAAPPRQFRPRIVTRKPPHRIPPRRPLGTPSSHPTPYRDPQPHLHTQGASRSGW